jgi:hypothetical protein
MPPELNSFSASSQSLEDLAHRVRMCCEAIRKAGLTALGHALDAGDCLNEAQARISTNWKKWLRENCFLAISTAQLYQQLARHRAEIEDEIVRFPELSLRAARRLIATPPKSKPEPKPSLVTAMKRATDAECTEALAAYGLLPFLRVMPPAWRGEMAARLRRNEEKSTPNKDLMAVYTATEILRRASWANQECEDRHEDVACGCRLQRERGPRGAARTADVGD